MAVHENESVQGPVERYRLRQLHGSLDDFLSILIVYFISIDTDECGYQLFSTADKQNKPTYTHTEETNPENEPKETEVMHPSG